LIKCIIIIIVIVIVVVAIVVANCYLNSSILFSSPTDIEIKQASLRSRCSDLFHWAASAWTEQEQELWRQHHHGNDGDEDDGSTQEDVYSANEDSYADEAVEGLWLGSGHNRSSGGGSGDEEDDKGDDQVDLLGCSGGTSGGSGKRGSKTVSQTRRKHRHHQTKHQQQSQKKSQSQSQLIDPAILLSRLDNLLAPNKVGKTN
jgi:hypothetical protein